MEIRTTHRRQGWSTLSPSSSTTTSPQTTTITSAVTMTTRWSPAPHWSAAAVLCSISVVLLSVGTCTARDQIQDWNMNQTESACFSSSPTKTLIAACPVRHMVIIVSLFYGYSVSGACAYTPGDCVQEDLLPRACLGRQVCQVNLPSGDLGRKIPHCMRYSNYMQLVYQCVPEVDVHDICAIDTLQTQTGYIRTPAYPNNYPASRQCTASIVVHPKQRLYLQIVDLNLQANQPACADMLYIQDSIRSSALCGVRGVERHNKVFTTSRNILNLTFISDETGTNKGFWLYYQAFPYMAPTTPTPTTTSTTTTTTRPTPTPSTHLVATVVLPPGGPGGGDSVLPPSESTLQTDSEPDVMQQSNRVPIEAIVGGLLGTLLCILLVLLILLIIKRRKEREAIPSSTSTCFLHSKVGSTSRGGVPYIQNNLGMVDDSPMC